MNNIKQSEELFLLLCFSASIKIKYLTLNSIITKSYMVFNTPVTNIA